MALEALGDTEHGVNRRTFSRRKSRKGQSTKRGGRHKVSLLELHGAAPCDFLVDCDEPVPFKSWMRLTQKVRAVQWVRSRILMMKPRTAWIRLIRKLHARSAETRWRRPFRWNWTASEVEEEWGHSTVWRPWRSSGGHASSGRLCSICRGFVDDDDGADALTGISIASCDTAHSPEGERKHAMLATAFKASASLATSDGSVAECEAVIDYVLGTLGSYGQRVRFLEISRLENPCVSSRYLDGGAVRFMFHGCRSQRNEDSILKNGFQVACCKSGGAGYGTWFAYNAAYSDSGFAFTDADNVKHLFVCIVSERCVAFDDYKCMRVVAQDCAYPVWLVKYQKVCEGFCEYYYYSDFYQPSDYQNDGGDGDLCENDDLSDDWCTHDDVMLSKELQEAKRATDHRHTKRPCAGARPGLRSALGSRVPDASRRHRSSKRGGRHKVSAVEWPDATYN